MDFSSPQLLFGGNFSDSLCTLYCVLCTVLSDTDSDSHSDSASDSLSVSQRSPRVNGAFLWRHQGCLWYSKLFSL